MLPRHLWFNGFQINSQVILTGGQQNCSRLFELNGIQHLRRDHHFYVNLNVEFDRGLGCVDSTLRKASITKLSLLSISTIWMYAEFLSIPEGPPPSECGSMTDE